MYAACVLARAGDVHPVRARLGGSARPRHRRRARGRPGGADRRRQHRRPLRHRRPAPTGSAASPASRLLEASLGACYLLWLAAGGYPALATVRALARPQLRRHRLADAGDLHGPVRRARRLGHPRHALQRRRVRQPARPGRRRRRLRSHRQLRAGRSGPASSSRPPQATARRRLAATTAGDDHT